MFLKLTLLFFLSVQQASAVSLQFIQRGFQSCTEKCDKESICPLDQDNIYRWCLKNCSYKFDIKGRCAHIIPTEMRPILPYEQFSGALSTNHVSIFALKYLDQQFIEQTKDKRRLVGTAKTLLLVREQLIKNKNVQALDTSAREKLAEELFVNFFKGTPSVIQEYRTKRMVPDDKISLLFKETKSEILAKINAAS